MTAPATLYEWTLLASGIQTPAVDADSRAIPTTRDIAFDHATKKFVRVAGDLTLTTGQAAIAQAIRIKLKMFLGEWFRDVTKGVPYLQEILGVKDPNLSVIKAELTEQIRTVAGVRSVATMTAAFNKVTRALSIAWSADTDFGTVDGNTSFNA